MPIYTLVYYETNRIEREVEAATFEQAIAADAQARDANGWEGSREEALGTNGVEEAWVDGEKVYDAGIQENEDQIESITLERRK